MVDLAIAYCTILALATTGALIFRRALRRNRRRAAIRRVLGGCQ